MRIFFVFAFCVISQSLVAQDQTKPKNPAKDAPVAKKPPERPDPTYADVVYGADSERQKFDFWRAD